MQGKLDFSKVKMDFSKVNAATDSTPVGASFPEKVNFPIQENRLDPALAKQAIQFFEDQVQRLGMLAREIVIDSDEKDAEANDLAAQAKRVEKRLEAKRKEITKEPREFVNRVNAVFKIPRDRIVESVKIIDQKSARYSREQLIRRREEEKRLREQQAKEQAELDAKAKKAGVESVKLPDIAVPQKTGPVRTESGTTSKVPVWKFEVTGADAVPREYCAPDRKKLDDAVKAGIRKIDGVRIYEDFIIKRRTV